MAPSKETDHSFTVAVDAMGGDFAPAEVVQGAIGAARRGDARILLVGDPQAVEAEMSGHDLAGIPITAVPSEGTIGEEEHPVVALRQKPHASVMEAAKLVKAGQAQAMVTMGSTGAALASATLILGLLEGLDRPALGGPLLSPLTETVLVDLGSNVDCRPSQLVGFAAIGSALARRFQGIEHPRVALLSVGAEAAKGNRQVQEAYPILQASGLNFVGNVEGTDLFQDRADVVVCDGFLGNILMKFAEGLSIALAHQLGRLLENRLPAQEVAQLGREVYELTNAVDRVGGGPLLGIDGVVIVGHGRSRASSIAKAIGMAKRTVSLGLVETMREELARVFATKESSHGN